MREERDAVGDGEGVLLVVRDEERGDAEAVERGAQLIAHVAAQRGIEVGQRLVEQEDAGLDDERAGEGDALLLAAGEALHRAVRGVGESDGGEGVEGAAFAIGLVHAAGFEAEGDVLADPQVREERVVLEDHAEVAGLRRSCAVMSV